MQNKYYLGEKLAFYSCFYGNNTNYSFKIPPIPSLKYKCYFYTNNQTLIKMLEKTKWIPVFDNISISDDPIESCMASKRVKVLPHKYRELSKYDYLCYLDSKLGKINELFVECFIQKYFILNSHALLLRKHIFIGPNVWDEYNESMKQNRYLKYSENYKRYINKQLELGFSEKVDIHSQCGLLIRNMKHPEINNINETWYSHIEECGIQDQISFFFVKQIFNNSINIIHSFPENPFTQHR